MVQPLYLRKWETALVPYLSWAEMAASCSILPFSASMSVSNASWIFSKAWRRERESVSEKSKIQAQRKGRPASVNKCYDYMD